MRKSDEPWPRVQPKSRRRSFHFARVGKRSRVSLPAALCTPPVIPRVVEGSRGSYLKAHAAGSLDYCSGWLFNLWLTPDLAQVNLLELACLFCLVKIPGDAFRSQTPHRPEAIRTLQNLDQPIS